MKMYFVALVLPDELDKEIKVYKKMMLERFGCKVGLKSPAHITLIPPSWIEPEMENSFIDDITKIGLQVFPFSIKTQNFSAFIPRTIFIAVEPNNDLDAVKKINDNLFKNHPLYKIKGENRPFHPHITIATRDMSKTTFYEAWELFKNKEYNATFEAKGLSILRHNGKYWDVLHTAPFR